MAAAQQAEPSAKVIVRNNSERVIGIMVPTSSVDTANPIVHEPVFLKPGTNEVTREIYERLVHGSSAQVFDSLTKEGKLSFAEPQGNQTISSFKPSEAVQMIQDCYDVSTLEQWLDEEKRKDVRTALREQLKTVREAFETKS